MDHFSFVFNAIIEHAGLRDIPISGRQFTWANNMPDPTYEKLDRVLVCPDWEDKYPMTMVIALEREISDHTPLLLDSGEHRNAPPIFRFENAWMHMEGFKEFVEKNWEVRCNGSSMDTWQKRLRNIRQKIKGWVLNANAMYRKR